LFLVQAKGIPGTLDDYSCSFPYC